jgi:hypothetical protein
VATNFRERLTRSSMDHFRSNSNPANSAMPASKTSSGAITAISTERCSSSLSPKRDGTDLSNSLRRCRILRKSRELQRLTTYALTRLDRFGERRRASSGACLNSMKKPRSFSTPAGTRLLTYPSTQFPMKPHSSHRLFHGQPAIGMWTFLLHSKQPRWNSLLQQRRIWQRASLSRSYSWCSSNRSTENRRRSNAVQDVGNGESPKASGSCP